MQLWRANGCNVIATDLQANLVGRAETFGAVGADLGVDIESLCQELTAGYGVDGVLICAGTSSNQPIEICGAVTCEKGKIKKHLKFI